MSIRNLDKIFQPASVIVVGSGETGCRLSAIVAQNLREGGFGGRTLQVNLDCAHLEGCGCGWPAPEAGNPVDLAVIAAPPGSIPSLVEICSRYGVAAAVLMSPPIPDAAPEKESVERSILEVAGGCGVRILGSNSFGIFSGVAALNASLAAGRPLPGKVAFISQSKSICAAILDCSWKEGIGFSHFVSAGDMLDIDYGDLVNYLGGLPTVGAIALHLERIRNFRKFMSAARAVSRVKPIVALKAGGPGPGTWDVPRGAPGGQDSDSVYGEAFKRAGIVRVRTIEELFDCAELMARQPRPRGARLAIVTNGSGPAAMAVAALEERGGFLARFETETLRDLAEVMPPGWKVYNPVNLMEDAIPERYRRAAEIFLQAREVDGLVVIMSPHALSDPTAVADSLRRTLKKSDTPVFTVWMGGFAAEKAREAFNRAGIPAYDTPERAIAAFMYMHSYARNLETLRQIPRRLPGDPAYDRKGGAKIIEGVLARGGKALSREEAESLLAAYGIPARCMEADLPCGDLDSGECSNQGCELFLGVRKDADLGPYIFLGAGGARGDGAAHRAIALPPLNQALARRLIQSARILGNAEGGESLRLMSSAPLEEVLVRLSQLITDCSEIAELTIDPLLAADDRIIAGNARILVERSGSPAPFHLILSSYPSQYEAAAVTTRGMAIRLRPIRPEDAPLLVEFFSSLSPTSIFYRFFRPMKVIPPEMLARFTQIDYDRDMAVAAFEDTDAGERMLGVARLMADPDVTRAEFAVAVGDSWHGKGVGAALLNHCISIAKERGLRSVWSMVLPDNVNMLALGRKLGFKISKIPYSGDYELRIDLDRIH